MSGRLPAGQAGIDPGFLGRAWQIAAGCLARLPGPAAPAEEILGHILGPPPPAAPPPPPCPYGKAQQQLAVLNERGEGRRAKGVYYTPPDLVDFLLGRAIRLACGGPWAGGAPPLPTADIPPAYLAKTVYDPTCGTGAFLLTALRRKLDRLALSGPPSRAQLVRVVATLYGNDLDPGSVAITRLRLFLCVLHRFGPEKAAAVWPPLRDNFTCRDFVSAPPAGGPRFDLVLGNPPYVEDGKCPSPPPRRYGNIYANVLENAGATLAPGGVLGFVIPLSYTATPRMQAIREVLFRLMPQQAVYSFSDRPDCLFPSVHQKLCVLFGRAGAGKRQVFTGNYRYWYKGERPWLFASLQAVENPFVTGGFIPKLGNALDISIYQKATAAGRPLLELLAGSGPPVYLNMRATFWVKAFLAPHTGGEYRAFPCQDAPLCMCLLNSSLFWWYWVCVSDCWHITRKELQGFRVPSSPMALQPAGPEPARLAAALEERLEATRVFVGTRQTAYEYKHRACLPEIAQIDAYISRLFGLTEEESAYIHHFALPYRAGGGQSNANGSH